MHPHIPRAVLLFGGLLVLLFCFNAVSLRLNPASDAGAPEAAAFTPYMQSLASRVASRDLAWAALMALALWRREARFVGAMFLLRALIELQDGLTLAVATARGAWPPSFYGAVAFVALLATLMLFAAWWLLRRPPTPVS